VGQFDDKNFQECCDVFTAINNIELIPERSRSSEQKRALNVLKTKLGYLPASLKISSAHALTSQPIAVPADKIEPVDPCPWYRRWLFTQPGGEKQSVSEAMTILRRIEQHPFYRNLHERFLQYTRLTRRQAYQRLRSFDLDD